MKNQPRKKPVLGLLVALTLLIGLLLVSLEAQPAVAQEAGSATADPSPRARAASLPFTTYVDVVSSDPDSLDPHWMYDSASAQIIAQVYETLLMQRREDPAAYIPLLGKSWSISADAKTYTFVIRSGVAFHEGGTLQPHDVAYSFWRGMLQDRGSGPMWMLLSPLLDVNDVEDIPGDDAAKCQAVKDSVTYDDVGGTVTFHLVNAFGPFLEILTHRSASILDQEWMTATGDWNGDCATWRDYHNPPAQGSPLYDQMNGTGPFRFDHWIPGEVRLRRFDGYWRTEPAWEEGPNGPAAFETVFVRAVADWEARKDMLLNGEADTIYVPQTNAAELDPLVWGVYEGFEDRTPLLVNPDIGSLRHFRALPTMAQTPLLFCYNISLNTNPYIGSGTLDGDGIPGDFFADLHVRKAFNYAMNWDAAINDAYGGEAVRARGPIPSGMLGYNEMQAVYEHNVALSTQEFQAAWGGQVWAQGFSMTVAYNEGNLVRKHILETLAQTLSSINPAFQVNVISLPWSHLLDAVGARQMPAYLGAWSEDYHHPHNWVHPYLHSQGGFGSYQGFPPAMADAFDAKVQECIAEAELVAAQTCYEGLQNMSYEQAAAAWGVQPIGQHYEATEVRGYYYSPARPPYYYALSKGPQPTVEAVDATVDITLTFANASESTTALAAPAGALAENSAVVYTPDIVVEESRPGGFRLGNLSFDLQVCQDGDCLEDYALGETVTLTLSYGDADIAGLIEDELYLYTWNGTAWVDAVEDCGWLLTAYGRYPEINELVVPVCHFSRFALVGGTNRTYLPLILRNN
jgi:peptide/nickel transport system substrate-binding protein